MVASGLIYLVFIHVFSIIVSTGNQESYSGITWDATNGELIHTDGSVVVVSRNYFREPNAANPCQYIREGSGSSARSSCDDDRLYTCKYVYHENSIVYYQVPVVGVTFDFDDAGMTCTARNGKLKSITDVRSQNVILDNIISLNRDR